MRKSDKEATRAFLAGGRETLSFSISLLHLRAGGASNGVGEPQSLLPALPSPTPLAPLGRQPLRTPSPTSPSTLDLVNEELVY
jgi:hypothetical protein